MFRLQIFVIAVLLLVLEEKTLDNLEEHIKIRNDSKFRMLGRSSNI